MNKIKEARKATRLSQQEVARCLGISVSSLNQWEMGLRNPKAGQDAIVRRIAILDHLTAEGRDAIADGEMSWNEANASYKISETRRLSKWGKYPDMFSKLWGRIPAGVEESCTPEALAELIDSFAECYQDGTQHRRGD